LSGHALIAAILAYLVWFGLPSMIDKFHDELNQQRQMFLSELKEQRQRFMEEAAESKELLRISITEERQERKQLTGVIEDLSRAIQRLEITCARGREGEKEVDADQKQHNLSRGSLRR
jgi:hypothetical protein